MPETPNKLVINLTPEEAGLESVLLEIERDSDGLISQRLTLCSYANSAEFYFTSPVFSSNNLIRIIGQIKEFEDSAQ